MKHSHTGEGQFPNEVGQLQKDEVDRWQSEMTPVPLCHLGWDNSEH